MRRSPGLMNGRRSPEPIPASADPGPPANYLDLYGLSKPPFGGTLDSGSYILFGSHRRKFEDLTDHLVNGSGVVWLFGEEGIGKSEMLRAAGSVAGEAGAQTILVSRPPDTRINLRQLASALGNQSETADPTADDTINSLQQPPRKALLIDDIDLMPNECVSLILAIARLKLGEQREPAILLSSAEDPAADPARQELSRLLSLSRNSIRMSRLSPDEVRQYIERSLWVAGGTTRRLITADAMKLLIARSGGVPGVVNRLMEATLEAGFAKSESMITAKTITAAIGPAASRPVAPAPRFVGPASRPANPVPRSADLEPRLPHLAPRVSSPQPPPGSDALRRGGQLPRSEGASFHDDDLVPRLGGRVTDVSRITRFALPAAATVLLLTGATVFLYKALQAPVQTIPTQRPVEPLITQLPKAPPVVATPNEKPQPPKQVDAKPPEAMPPELVAALMKRGDQLLELGDIAAARLVFQRAAEAGNAAAATVLGKTYDPNLATSANPRDAGRAAEWYKKAAALGDPKATDLLKRLGSR